MYEVFAGTGGSVVVAGKGVVVCWGRRRLWSSSCWEKETFSSQTEVETTWEKGLFYNKHVDRRGRRGKT